MYLNLIFFAWLYFLFITSKFLFSSSSFTNPFVTLMPLMLDSKLAFISAVTSLTFLDVFERLRLEKITINMIIGMETITMTASSQRIFNRRKNEPKIVKTAMKKSSGP